MKIKVDQYLINPEFLIDRPILCAKVYLGINLIYEGKFKYLIRCEHEDMQFIYHYYICSIDNEMIADLVSKPSFVFLDEAKYDKNAITNFSNLSKLFK